MLLLRHIQNNREMHTAAAHLCNECGCDPNTIGQAILGSCGCDPSHGLTPGDSVWVLEWEDGKPSGVSEYMLLAYSGNFVIAAWLMDDSDYLDDTLGECARETAENGDVKLYVFPTEDCFDKPEAAFSVWGNERKEGKLQ